jgi:hypothetical protein
MGRKKKNTDTGQGLALLLFGVIIYFVSIFIAQYLYIILLAIFLVCFIWNLVLFLRDDRHWMHRKFELALYQFEKMQSAKKTLIEQKNRLDECNKIIEDEGLRKNMDGRLSQRSYRGKEIQEEMDRAQGLLDESMGIYDYYLELPLNSYKKARRHSSRIWASLFATLLCALMVFFEYTIGTNLILHINGSEILLNGSKISILIVGTYIVVFLIVYIVFSIVRKKP